MSHKATAWLASLPPSAMNGSGFRVLFFLCDYHNDDRNPLRACFPSQDTLRERCALSNGGLNKVLNTLETDGLIQRIRTTAPGEKARRTYYILGCDMEAGASQTPQSGEVSNSTSVEADTPSNSTPVANKLHLSGDDPVRNHTTAAASARETSDYDDFPRPDPADVSNAPTHRERILAAIGADPVSGLYGPNGKMFGTPVDMQHVARWSRDLGLTIEEQEAVIRDAVKRSRKPVFSFKFFDGHMADFAGAKNAEPLTPTAQNVTPIRGTRHDRSEQRRRDATEQEFIRRFGTGEIQRGPDPSDPFAGR